MSEPISLPWAKEITEQIASGKSSVILLHGNVRDYGFDAHLGFASLPDRFETYWVDSGLFSAGLPHSEAGAIRYSMTEGIVVQRVTDGGASCGKLVTQVEAHREEVAQLDLEHRISRDLAFITELLHGDHDPPLLVYLERPGLLFPPRGDHFRTSSWVEYVLRWAAHAPQRDTPSDREVLTSRRGRHLVVLAADGLEEVSPELRKRAYGIVHIDVGRPGTPLARRRMLAACMAACNAAPVPMPFTRLGQRAQELPIEVHELDRMVEATAGLNFQGIESTLLNILERGVLRGQALPIIKEQRTQLIHTESEGLIELIEPTRSLDDIVGGLAVVRERLDGIIKGMAGAPASPERLLVPAGVLFVGPPGTGKSLTAEALAHACDSEGVHFVRMGDFRDMWVGQSERNFSRILRVLETFGRVIVFMDELDQSEGGSRSGGDRHETSRRIFGQLLSFMGEDRHRGNILWIGATNRPDLLDPALVRPGRFDVALPFNLPDPAGCRAILEVHLPKAPVADQSTIEGRQTVAIAMHRARFSGAEIQLVAAEAARRVRALGRDAIRDADLLEVTSDYDGTQKNTGSYVEMLKACRDFIPFRSLRGEA